MSRLADEQHYWDSNALDPDVDVKYISDVPVELCLKDLPKMTGEVLEIGCGVGRLLQDFWHGVDISKNMVEIAQLRKPLCFIKLGNGRTLPYQAETFDFVYCYLVFQHLKLDAIATYMQETYRVLKETGTFTFQWIEGDEHEPFSNHYTKDNIESLLRYNGFKIIVHKKSVAHKSWTITEARK